MKKKQLTTEKRLGVQLYLVLFLYTVTGIGLGILAQFIFPKRIIVFRPTTYS